MRCFANSVAAQPAGGPPENKPDFPPHTEVLKDFEQVVSSIDKAPTSSRSGSGVRTTRCWAVFPEKFAEKKFFIALTVASGQMYAGLQAR